MTELTVKTNDLKKGDRVRLHDGCYATIYDNKKGNVRMAEVEGFYTEIGSVYSYDIVHALVGGNWLRVEHTPEQLRLKALVRGVFGE